MNSSHSGKDYKKKLSDKKKNSKTLSGSDNLTNNGGLKMLKQIKQKKRGYCHFEESDTSLSAKALKTDDPTKTFLDNIMLKNEQNICLSPDISIIYENISQTNQHLKNIEKQSVDKNEGPKAERASPIKETKSDIFSENTIEDFTSELKAEFSESFEATGTELSSSDVSQTMSDILNINEETDFVKLMENSELLSFLLKGLIKYEIEKQMKLESQSLKNGRKVEKLLLQSDCEILMKFFKLSNGASRVFVRMLGRKKFWHRVNAINYKEISDNLTNEFQELKNENYVDINIEDENLKTQLALLNKPEILNLCKKFNVSSKKISSGKKDDCINFLIQEIEKQKSVVEMFRPKNSSVRINLLKKEIKESLGMCVKLNDKTLETFHKVLLLNSFAYYRDDEDLRFSKVLFLYSLVHKKQIKFPNYNVCPTVIFETQTDFEKYKKALLLQNSCEIAIRNKDFDAFILVCNEAKAEFNQLLYDNEYRNRLSNLKSFLWKFTAGTVYARILTHYCTTFQKKVNKEEVIKIAELLLNQNLFLGGKKGVWYEILSKSLENQKQNNEAAEVLIRALRDPLLTEVHKVVLQLRGQLMLKKSNCGIKDVQLRDTLDQLCTLSLSEPHKIEIRGAALDGNKSGHKIVYKQEIENGVAFTSVEEKAIFHYKSIGYTKGYHSEGSIIQSIYFLLFFDIIYGLSPEGVFQSPYQEAPLDFNSSCFYKNRKEEIDLLLNDMCNWDDKEMEEKIRYAYRRNYGNVCLIKWNTELTEDDFCEVVKCISMPSLVCIFQRFINNFREARAGFPDLTLWNPENKKCIFVEVKSPSDKLSPAQRVWLEFLKNIGLDCEVCNVKNVSSKGCG